MRKTNETRTAAASLAAIGSIVLASGCCLPVLPLVAAAGVAGASTLLISAKPYLMGLSALLIGYGFYRARQARQCSTQPGAIATILLWTSALLVGFSIFLPQVVADLAASLLDRS
jgi:hypothetical protein